MVLEIGSGGLFPEAGNRFDEEIRTGTVKDRTIAYYVGGDYIQGSTGSESLSTIASYTIPANTVVNGIHINVAYTMNDSSSNLEGFLYIYLDSTAKGSRTNAGSYADMSTPGYLFSTFDYFGDGIDWAVEHTVYVKARVGNSGGGVAVVCDILEITGY